MGKMKQQGVLIKEGGIGLVGRPNGVWILKRGEEEGQKS
jgi:hypothetical protein